MRWNPSVSMMMAFLGACGGESSRDSDGRTEADVPADVSPVDHAELSDVSPVDDAELSDVSDATPDDDIGEGFDSNDDVAVPEPLLCPTQAGPNNPMPANCETPGSLCAAGTACGICMHVEGCNYYASGPKWQYADALQNTNRSECPSEVPVNQSPCDVDFLEPSRPACEYCVDGQPLWFICALGEWAKGQPDNCP